MRMTLQNAVQFINSQAQNELHKDKSGHGWICPICHSGTGPKGTGITSKDGVHFTCFAGQCFSSASWIDIKAIQNGIDPKDTKAAIHNACQIYGIELENDRTWTGTEVIMRQKKTDTKQTERKDYTTDFEKWHRDIYEREPLEYLRKRGITKESIERFNLGYCGNIKGIPAIIFPTSPYSFNARNINENAASSDRFRKSEGEFELFNIQALETTDQPIFITEAELDAISIMQAGGNAIALGGVGGIKKLLEKARDIRPKQTLIIALDNDKQGEKTANDLKTKETELLKEGIELYFADTADLYFGNKDANEAWQANEFMLMNTVENTKDAKRQEALTQLQKDSVANARNEYLQAIKNSNSYITTRFEKLDKILDGGLYPGLYVIGAISSLGKTTLCLQIGDHIAKDRNDVLIFSLEMSRHELIAKSISRLTSVLEETHKNAKTTRGIITGEKYANYSDAELKLIEKATNEYFTEYATNLYIYEGMGNIGAREIRQKVEAFKSIKGKAPVVIVDYVQIMAPASDSKYLTDKQNIDFNISELKRISRDYNIPILAISSFNRENYITPVSMTSFKESGAIEYSSDVLIGLQYKAMAELRDLTESKQKAKASEILDKIAEEARAGKPIEVQLKILKCRNGVKDVVNFDFYPMFNKFVEKKDNNDESWH